VASLFWGFRVMVGLGFYFIFAFAFAFYLASKRDFGRRWFLRLITYSLPLPWLAAELGWFVAEHGRQPWSIEGILPTFLSSSSLSGMQVLFTLIGFIVFYSSLAAVDLFLMQKYVRMGPVKALDIPPNPPRSTPTHQPSAS
jgi:cytochrome d ubiquinol oxidase subunit I